MSAAKKPCPNCGSELAIFPTRTRCPYCGFKYAEALRRLTDFFVDNAETARAAADNEAVAREILDEVLAELYDVGVSADETFAIHLMVEAALLRARRAAS